MNGIQSPISCAFHDKLELRALRRQRCRMVILDVADREIIVETVIEDLITHDGREFAVLESGVRVPLDRIVSIDGTQA